MHASIAAGFLAYLQHELLSGDDMPFGALSSALQVRNVSYLWSLEFWASATSPCLRGRRKYSFLLLTLSSILLAATVGPLVAIALIPRQTSYPAANVPIQLWFTEDEIYPNPIGTDNVASNCLQANSDIYLGWDCPNSDWLFLDEMSALEVQLTSQDSIRQLSICSSISPIEAFYRRASQACLSHRSSHRQPTHRRPSHRRLS
jgi:hypothetical protein